MTIGAVATISSLVDELAVAAEVLREARQTYEARREAYEASESYVLACADRVQRIHHEIEIALAVIEGRTAPEEQEEE